jgi:FtsZ-binding cell division protein ZapB
MNEEAVTTEQEEEKKDVDEAAAVSPVLTKDGSDILQEVEEIKERFNGVITDSDLSHKVDAVLSSIESLSLEVQNWRTVRKDTYIDTLENLKKQVSEIESEWDAVSASMKAQRERLESLLESFPGVIETSSVRALSLRVTHLEKLVSELVDESTAKASAKNARKQFIISLTALGVTIVLWGVWIVLAVMK